MSVSGDDRSYFVNDLEIVKKRTRKEVKTKLMVAMTNKMNWMLVFVVVEMILTVDIH